MTSKAILGIDIGTTNISAVIFDAEENVILNTYQAPNASRMESEKDFAEFDASGLIGTAKQIIDEAICAYPNICAIGVTGQMHGMVYVSSEGKILSPLYNWQDGRGNRNFSSEKTYCEEILERTGHLCHTGYACATLFYNRINQLQPDEATSFCSITDCLVMALTAAKKPLIHTTNAAAFGLFDIQNYCFDQAAFERLGLSCLTLPEVTEDAKIAGYYRGIPVAVAIGDNQASFFGSVRDDHCALVNFGTGSQISLICDCFVTPPKNMEIRPYLFGKYLLCGSALCGGKAYAILEQFFHAYAGELNPNPGSQYETMNRLAEAAYCDRTALSVSTLFCGTRQNPSLRGSITGISDTNFTPGSLILGVLQGMTDELKGYFDTIPHTHITSLAASGNAVKKNTVLQKLLRDTFRMPLTLTDTDEEAALGCARFAHTAIMTGDDRI